MTMKDIVVALAVFLAVSVGYGLLYRHNRSEWEARVESTLKDAEAWEAQAAVFRALAETHERRADSLDASATGRVRVVRERVVEVREVEVPAIARPFVAVRDSIIDELLVAVDEKDDAIAEYVSVNEFLRQESQKFEIRGDSLEAVLLDRPGPRKWWMPQTGVGGFVGMCSGGGICSGVGLTLSWSPS
ncbi:MAG: hypothetical protein V3S55_14895 [Nitrospiraceae bacterium]